MHCPSCGGILGRDCFNPTECAMIANSMNEFNNQEEIESIKHELTLANQTILTLQLANEQLQHEIQILKP